MVVYADLLFMINFSMDFLCFYLSCLLLHRRLPTLRASVASVFGGVYSVLALFLSVSQPVALIIDVSVMVLMCTVVFAGGGTGALKIAKICGMYFFVSTLLGGVMTALFSLFNGLDIFAGELEAGDGINVWIFALLAIAGTVFTAKGGRIFRPSQKGTVYIEIESEHGAVRLKALVDSGNLACEPISGKAVAFATLASCKDILSHDLYIALSDGITSENIPLSDASRIRFIPSSGIGGSRILPAVKFKKIIMISEKSKKPLDIYIAFINDSAFGEYDAIISDEAAL